MRRMLERNQLSRISAKEALEHAWMKMNIVNQNVGDELLTSRLKKLAQFCCQSKLVQASIHLIIQ